MGRGREIAEGLIGTCDGYPEGFDDLTPEELAEFDDVAFLCEACGWWCAVGEEGCEPGQCDECAPCCGNCGGCPDECGCHGEPECPHGLGGECCGDPDDCPEDD